VALKCASHDMAISLLTRHREHLYLPMTRWSVPGYQFPGTSAFARVPINIW